MGLARQHPATDIQELDTNGFPTIPAYLIVDWGPDTAKAITKQIRESVEAELGRQMIWECNPTDMMWRLVPAVRAQ